ncbi:MAG TPA: DUF5677 domain-containing protein [Candidatus Polarisedimenticolia bacterium]|nr:DUF5677 domain-containing protein [Candidatus Polarisedimenticolia bacterium]
MIEKIWEEHHQPLVALYDLMADVGQALRKLPEGWQPRSAQKVVVLHLFVRAYKTTQAAYTLFSSGFAQDAQSLLRGLTEGVIDMFYILRKPGTRGRQFADYIVIGKRDWMRRMEKAFHEYPIPPHVMKKVEAEYTALLSRRPNYKGLTRSWSSEGIAERARDGNCKNLYFYYVLACQMLHTDPRSVHSYLRVGEGMDDGPSMPTTEERKTLEIAYVCLLDAFNASNGVFKWHRGDLVKEYKGRFRREFGDKASPARTQAIHRTAPGAVTTP